MTRQVQLSAVPGRHFLPTAVLLLLVQPCVAWAHGGVGLPVLHITRPGPGEILEWSGGAPVELRWQDEDPDDDANLVLSRQADLDDPLTLEAFLSGASEDCDPAPNGPVFTGMMDAGSGPFPSQMELNLQRCGMATQACVETNDCTSWTPLGVPVGVYRIVGALDDDRGDGIPADVSSATSPGVVRISAPGVNVPPALVFLEPDGVGDIANTCFHAAWHLDDPDDDALVDVWLERVDGAGVMMLATNVLESTHPLGLELQLGGLPDLSEWTVHARVQDGHWAPFHTVAPGHLYRSSTAGRDGGCVAWAATPDAGNVSTADAATPGTDAGAASLLDAATAPDAAALPSQDQDAGPSMPDTSPPPARQQAAACACSKAQTSPHAAGLLAGVAALFRSRRRRPALIPMR